MPNTASFDHTVERLCRLSVRKAHDPFRDIPLDLPEFSVDPRDPRFELLPDEPLGATAWYAEQLPETRARLGLEFLCQAMRFGIALETSLSRGLLAFIEKNPNQPHVFRYVLHEVIEECRHSMMFHAFIERSGCTTHGLHAADAFLSELIVRNAARFPELYFVHVLAGEIFIDVDNRMRLAHKAAIHPLVALILRIHVTEEARHMHFAERYLDEHMPSVSTPERLWIRAYAPLILRGSARVLLEPSAALVRKYGIPREVLRSAYGPGTTYRARVSEISAPVLALLAPKPHATLGHADPDHGTR